MEAHRSDEEWLALAQKKEITPDMLYGVDLQNEDQKKWLYERFGYAERYGEQIQLLNFLRRYKDKRDQGNGDTDPKRRRIDSCGFTNVRNDSDKLPSQFAIGEYTEFKYRINPTTFLDQSFQFIMESDGHSVVGSRRPLGSLVAISGWGKTSALTLLAEELVKLRTTDPKDIPMERTIHDTLKTCVPLLITFNGNMALKRKTEINYGQEIGKRLAYAYFADMKKIGFPEWVNEQTGYHWNVSDVLKKINNEAEKALGEKPLVLLVVDSPDHLGGASEALEALYETALNAKFEVKCCVLFSSHEQRWLYKVGTASWGREILDVKLDPPPSAEVEKLLTTSLREALKDTNEDDLKSAARYIVTLASGHWRTVDSAFKTVKHLHRFYAKPLKESVGSAQAYVPKIWEWKAELVSGQLEEALAHSILGSELHWMEPLHKGPAWQAIVNGVVPMWLGYWQKNLFEPIVPLLTLLRLSNVIEGLNKSLVLVQRNWDKQSNSERRKQGLLRTLSFARFFRSPDRSAQVPDFTSHFVLLQWDARERIDSAVRRRWSLKKEDLIPQIDKEDRNYDPDEVERHRNLANIAWARSKEKQVETYSLSKEERPHLWLVPPENAQTSEFERRLQLFRGAFCCTKHRAKEGIQVVSPDANAAIIATCAQKLSTRGASIDVVGKLKAGSVIQPANGNCGFDVLILLQKPDASWTLVLLENKLETGEMGPATVKEKLGILPKYRGVLWKSMPADSSPTNAESLHLPNVVESDVVWVMLHDEGYRHFEQSRGGIPAKARVNETELAQWTELGETAEEKGKEVGFQGHVLLTTCANFFGPSFQKVLWLHRGNETTF